MRRACHLIALGLLASSVVRAQQPGCTLDPRALRAICKEVLPGTGYFHVSTGKDLIAKCPCEELLVLSLAGLDSLRAQRDDLYRERIQRARKPRFRFLDSSRAPRAPGPVFKGYAEGEALRVDTGMYLSDEAHCHSESRLLGIAARIASLEEIDADITGKFQITVVYGDTGDQRFMAILPQETIGWFMISIPAPLLCDAAITDEMLVFMLLHEIGHVLADEEDDAFELASEFEADRWASAVGLSAYYGDEQAAVVRERVAEGYRHYYEHIYLADHVERSSCGREGIDNYPQLTCRAHAIVHPAWADDQGTLLTAYPDSCWDVCAAGEVRMIIDATRPWDRSACCPEREFQPCPFFPLMCAELSEVEEMMERIATGDKMNGSLVCDRFPDVCRLQDNEAALAKLRKWTGPKDRRIAKRLQKVANDLRSIESDLLRGP